MNESKTAIEVSPPKNTTNTLGELLNKLEIKIAEAKKCSIKDDYKKLSNELVVILDKILEKFEIFSEPDKKRVQFLYGLAKQFDEAIAQYYLGREHPNGTHEQEQEAVRLWSLAAEQGLAAAQYHLSKCYKHGRGVEKNQQEAQRLLDFAVQQGYPPAQTSLGRHCAQQGNQEEAIRLFLLAAEQGDADANCHLGLHFWNGEGVEKDEKKAVNFLYTSAELGCVTAQYNLASLYINGKIRIPAAPQTDREKSWFTSVRDFFRDIDLESQKEGARWLRQAAAQGHQQAKDLLGQRPSFKPIKQVADEEEQEIFQLTVAKTFLDNKKAKETGHTQTKINELLSQSPNQKLRNKWSFWQNRLKQQDAKELRSYLHQTFPIELLKIIIEYAIFIIPEEQGKSLIYKLLGKEETTYPQQKKGTETAKSLTL